MAINKERLEELINEGATIWCSYRLNYNVTAVDLTDKKRFVIYTDDMSILDRDTEYTYQLKNLYETQKEAEWHLKYHATRTEELNLPMFDEKQDITYWFFDAKGFEILLVCVNGEVGVLRYDNKALDKELFCEPATEENYIKACDLCLKLFKEN